MHLILSIKKNITAHKVFKNLDKQLSGIIGAFNAQNKGINFFFATIISEIDTIN